jgi:hypothetical protein
VFVCASHAGVSGGGNKVDYLLNLGNVPGAFTQTVGSTTIDTRPIPGASVPAIYNPAETLNTYLTLPRQGQIYGGYPFSFSCQFYAPSASTLVFMFEAAKSDGSAALFFYMGGGTEMYFGYNHSGGNITHTIIVPATTGRLMRVTAVCEQNNDRAWVNGVKTFSSTSSFTPSALTGPVYLFRRIAGILPGMLGGITDLCIWDRALSDAEVIDHYHNPYQFLTGPRRAYSFGAGGASGGRRRCSIAIF